MTKKKENNESDLDSVYELDAQIGFLLRRAHQRHVSIFKEYMTHDLTPQQLAVLARLNEVEAVSQNELGRQTAMDQSTINGVVRRLLKRGLLLKKHDDNDKRRIVLELSDEGKLVFQEVFETAQNISKMTLQPLKPQKRLELLKLLELIS